MVSPAPVQKNVGIESMVSMNLKPQRVPIPAPDYMVNRQSTENEGSVEAGGGCRTPQGDGARWKRKA